MSEKQKAFVALKLVFETSKAALAFLVDPVKDHDIPLHTPHLSVLHTDFLSLLSLIHASTTKTSLVLKPSSPSYAASFEPLQELADRVAALPHCVNLLRLNHGRTLATEATNTAKDVLEGIKSLIQTFITIESQGPSSTGEAGDEYLIRTGTVHDIINKARGQGGFSGNNFVAVRKVWQRNQESLSDGVNEIHEILEDAETSEAGSGEEDHFDDGWGELGLPSGIKPSVGELNRIKKIYAVARLSALLHQRILEDILSPLSPSSSPSINTNTVLDDIAQASSDILISSDNFISTMYPPQVEEDISIELEHYRRQLSMFQSKVDPLIPRNSIEELLNDFKLSNTSKSVDHPQFRKWYTVCINQIEKNIHELVHELKGVTSPAA